MAEGAPGPGLPHTCPVERGIIGLQRDVVAIRMSVEHPIRVLADNFGIALGLYLA